MSPDRTDPLLLENQLCFPLYACARAVTRQYKPYLDALGLTYTQYITMMVLWEEAAINVKRLGERLRLDSGTLTPLLKKLEAAGFITRQRSSGDERQLIVRLTERGAALKDAAADIPRSVGSCLRVSPEEAGQLYSLLYRMLDDLEGA